MVLCIVTAVVVTMMLGDTETVNIFTCDKIHAGMTVGDVDKIMGRPADEVENRLTEKIWCHRWLRKDEVACVQVQFNSQGKALGWMYSYDRKRLTASDKIRMVIHKWLR